MRPGPFFFRAQATPPFGDSSGKEKVAPVARPTSGPSQGREAPLHTSFEQGGGAYIGCRAAKPPGSVGPLARPLPLPTSSLHQPWLRQVGPAILLPTKALAKTLSKPSMDCLGLAPPSFGGHLWWPKALGQNLGQRLAPPPSLPPIFALPTLGRVMRLC